MLETKTVLIDTDDNCGIELHGVLHAEQTTRPSDGVDGVAIQFAETDDQTMPEVTFIDGGELTATYPDGHQTPVFADEFAALVGE